MEEKKLNNLKEVYDELLEYGCLDADSIEQCVLDHNVTCLLSIIENGKQLIYFGRYGEVKPIRHQIELIDCIHVDVENSRIKYFDKMLRPMPDLSASVGFLNCR